MKALLLAAGFGTRLRPITDRIPKCLVEIRGKPLLEYWLDLLLLNGMEKVLINTHYLAEAVNAFIQSYPLRDKVRLLHEEGLLGTGGTVLKSRGFFADGPFLLAHADNLTRFNLKAFIYRHIRQKHRGTSGLSGCKSFIINRIKPDTSDLDW